MKNKDKVSEGVSLSTSVLPPITVNIVNTAIVNREIMPTLRFFLCAHGSKQENEMCPLCTVKIFQRLSNTVAGYVHSNADATDADVLEMKIGPNTENGEELSDINGTK